MIQSGKFDSFCMGIKKLANLAFIFLIKRLIEIIGIFISIFGILLFIALISYSPTDPNFIFPKNIEIKNILGFHGSHISDIFFQSIGLISYLISITYIFTGINIFKKKEIYLFLENNFFIIIYTLIGSSFFNSFHNNTFSLYINGNGGFVGNYLNKLFLKNIIGYYENIFYYFFIFLIILFFLLSINFNYKNFIQISKKIILLFFKKDLKNYTDKNEIINEYIPQDEIKNLIQEDLPFIKSDKNQSSNELNLNFHQLIY